MRIGPFYRSKSTSKVRDGKQSVVKVSKLVFEKINNARTSKSNPARLDEPGLSKDWLSPSIYFQNFGDFLERSAYPPCNQMNQGSLLPSVAFWVSDPFCDSNPQKKSVSFGCPARFTGRFPAKLRASGADEKAAAPVIFGSASVTSKSVVISFQGGRPSAHFREEGVMMKNRVNSDGVMIGYWSRKVHVHMLKYERHISSRKISRSRCI